jgi:3-hydroxyisobutyrate dehydrogenase-like beta-hydroxyacid dehydrogenase
MDIGFVGLGNMGAAMAANLIAAGHTVTAYNRSYDKVEALEGARPARTVAEACTGDVVVSMLADDHAVEAVAFGADGILAALPESAVHVSCSTISVALAERLTAAHAEAGQHLAAAPVFGRPEAARAAKLFVVAAAEPEVLRTIEPILDAVGQRTFVVGSEPKAANLVKLSGNFEDRVGHRNRRGGNGTGLQGRCRQGAVPRDLDLDAVRRTGVPDLRRAAGARGVRARRLRCDTRPQGHSPRARGR